MKKLFSDDISGMKGVLDFQKTNSKEEAVKKTLNQMLKLGIFPLEAGL